MGDKEKKQLTPSEVFSNKMEINSLSSMKQAKIPLLIASGLVLILSIIYMVASLYDMQGSFTVKLSNPRDRSLSLSETRGFSSGTTTLHAMPNDNMDNFTYDWFDFSTIDSTDGAHNGDSYIAYTFYLKNAGSESIDYEAKFEILGVTRGIDHAVRFMIYRDGVPTVYAKQAPTGETEPVPAGVVNFESDNCVVTDTERDVPVGTIKKYTIVVWLEGEDPECIDNVLGGKMQFEVNFSVIE